MRLFGTVLTLFVLSVVCASPASADEYIVLAGSYPPFCYNKGLHVDGVSVDTLETIMDMTKTPFNRRNIKLMALDKAYSQAERLPKRIVLNVPRTPEVEEKFKWVGPIYFPKYVLVGKKGNKVTISVADDILKYKIGAIRGSDAIEALQEDSRSSKIKSSSSYVQPLLQLKKGEVDMVAHTDAGTAYFMHKMRMNRKKYEVEFVYRKVPLYFAFSKDTDDATIKLYNDALASYKIAMAHGDSAFAKDMRKHLPRGVID